MEKIMILDDDEAIRTLCTKELKDEGYEVIFLEDVSTVLQFVEEKRPDLILLDIRLGEYDGLNTLQDIRNYNYTMPIILYTSYPMFKYDIRSLAADYYLVKSSNLEELKLLIKVALKRGGSYFSVRAFENFQQGFVLNDEI